jgi:hypothetical protein
MAKPKINDKSVEKALKELEAEGTIKNVATKKLAKAIAAAILGDEATKDSIETTLSILQAIQAERTGSAEEGEDVDHGNEDAGDEGESEGGTHSAVRPRYKQKYAAESETKTGCGDEFDVAFRTKTDGKEKEELHAILKKIADDNGIEPERFAKWEGLKNRDGSMNVGMIRMNLSNVLRAKHRNGDKVKIGSQTFAADPEKQKERKEKQKAKAERLKELAAKKKAKAEKPAKASKEEAAAEA